MFNFFLLKRFDDQRYFKSMFDEIDRNRDGRITQQELHEALRRGYIHF